MASAEGAFAPPAEMDNLRQQDDTFIKTNQRSEEAEFL